jgi:type II secretory pathway pseudopilin PulG
VKSMIPHTRRISKRRANPQKGYLLLSVMLLITVMMIALAIEVPRISQQIKRQKEEELIHRGKEYANAIRKFYRKNGTYPVSLEQLESTNNLRFLRKRYKDPLTESGEWKPVHYGEAQLPLTNTAGAGAPGAGGTPGVPGSTGTLNTSNPFASTPTPAPSAGGFNAPSGQAGLNPGGGLQQGNQPGTGQLGTLTVQSNSSSGGGPIIGVASTSKKTSIKEFNGNSEYDQWLFVYEPRLEQSGGTASVAIAAPVGSSGSPGLIVGAAGPSQGTPGAPGTPPAPGGQAPAPNPTPAPLSLPR